MARFMLDTNICIYIRQKRPPAILTRFERLKPGDACISMITYGELRYGAEKSIDRDTALALLAELVNLLPVAPMPAETAIRYGALRADLERRGEVIGNNDLWIAANALALGTTLVTNNTREFERVSGLGVESWARD
jgi:tRNA(fMet)-specific endonuclease VapC